jgi:hypothetical protein
MKVVVSVAPQDSREEDDRDMLLWKRNIVWETTARRQER